MNNILKIQKTTLNGDDYELHYIGENGTIYGEVYRNGIYICPGEWPSRITDYVADTVDMLVDQAATQ